MKKEENIFAIFRMFCLKKSIADNIPKESQSRRSFSSAQNRKSCQFGFLFEELIKFVRVSKMQ